MLRCSLVINYIQIITAIVNLFEFEGEAKKIISAALKAETKAWISRPRP